MIDEKEPIAINRLTGTLFGKEPYNQGIDWVEVKILQNRQIELSSLASGEFGDTASTVAAGEALGRARRQQEESQKNETTKSPLIPAKKI